MKIRHTYLLLFFAFTSTIQLNAQTTESDSLRIQSLINSSKKYLVSFPDSAKLYADSAIFFGEKSEDLFNIATANKLIGISFLYKGINDSAIFYYKKARPLFEEIQDSLQISTLDLTMGQYERSVGNFEDALKYMLRAVRYFEKESQKRFQGIAYDELAQVYSLTGDHESALTYFKKAHAMAIEQNNPVFIANTTGNLGSVYNYLEQKDSAMFYSKKAVKLHKRVGNVGAYGNGHQVIGNIHRDSNNYDSAIYHFNEAVVSYEKIGHPKGMCEVLHNMGTLSSKFNDHKVAIGYFEASINIGKSINDAFLTKLNYQALSNSYSKIGNYKQALAYHQKFYQMSDSLLNVSTYEKVEELKAQYETEKKEEQIKFQVIQIASQQLVNNRNIILIFALCLGIIMILFIALLLRNRLQKKQQLLLQQKALEYKELQMSAIIDSQEKERKRFATDLHDGFGQLISILKLNVESIEQQKDDEKRHSLFEKSTAILNDMYGELRNICFNLMPQSLVKFGLIPSLKEFADKINDSGKLVVEVLAFDMDERLPNLQEISLYRITQEWVNNILKYGDAENITIQITKDNFEITLTIEDNGTGFELEKLIESKGNGWKNMRSRANLIHTDIEIDTNPHVKGNLLSINLPMNSIHETMESEKAVSD